MGKYLPNCYTGTILLCPTLPVCCTAAIHSTRSACKYLANCYTGTISYHVPPSQSAAQLKYTAQGMCVNTWLTIIQVPSSHVPPSYPAAQLKYTRSVLNTRLTDMQAPSLCLFPSKVRDFRSKRLQDQTLVLHILDHILVLHSDSLLPPPHPCHPPPPFHWWQRTRQLVSWVRHSQLRDQKQMEYNQDLTAHTKKEGEIKLGSILPSPVSQHFTNYRNGRQYYSCTCNNRFATNDYNTTLLPSVNTTALGMLCGAKYTHHSFTPVTKDH